MPENAHRFVFIHYQLVTHNIIAETPKGEAQGTEQVVHIEQFGNMLVWFGPIVDFTTRKVVLLDTIYNVLSKPCVLLLY